MSVERKTLGNTIVLLIENDLNLGQNLSIQLGLSGFTVRQIQKPNTQLLISQNQEPIDFLVLNPNSINNEDEFKIVEQLLDKFEIPLLFLETNTDFHLPKEYEKLISFGILNPNSSPYILESTLRIVSNLHSTLKKSKEKEKVLSENVELMQSILDSSTDFIFVKDTNLRTILCNEMVAKSVGKNASDLLGHNDIENGVDIELVKGNPEKGIRGYENDDLAALSGETLSNPEDLVYSNGQVYVFDTVKRPLRNRKGEIIGLLGISRDVTERKKIQNQLVESEKRFRMLYTEKVSGMSIHEIILDEFEKPIDFRFLDVNPAFERLTGLRSKDIIGKTIREVLPAHAEHWINIYGKVALTGENIKFEDYAPEFNKYFSISAFSYSRGYFAVDFEDITEKNKLEAMIQRNQKLESIGILAGGIAHDFNNLLAGIFGYLEIALMYSKENVFVTDFLNKAISAYDRAKALTLQLLTFSKGGNPIKKIASLIPILKTAIPFSFSGSSIAIEYDLDENLWITEIDENQIAQVIDNIALNAQQAMPDGGKFIVRAENIILKQEEFPISKSSQTFVKISLQDNGIGIPKEILPRVFDPFFSTKIKGNGLGLTTAYSIIKKHEGFLDIESEQGKGSTFIIYLPALKTKPVTYSEEREFVPKGKARILLMDDERYIQEIEYLRMNTMGYQVFLANHGDEAIQIFKEAEEKGNQFQLVILDLTIPGGRGGIQTLEEIRKINSSIPVIIASGYSESPAIATPTEYGFNASLKKPYSKDELIKILNKFAL